LSSAFLAVFLLFFSGEELLAHSNDQETYNQADSLRGALRPERTCYDVLFYHLDLTLDPVNRTIEGSNRMLYNVVEPTERLQVDLFENMNLHRIADAAGKNLAFTRQGNAVFVNLEAPLQPGTLSEMTLYYGGEPIAAANAPWDGGFTWKEDGAGNPWIGVSCEGIGASLWWPNKDHPADEPDSMLVSVRVPEGLVFVGNGTPRGQTPAENGYTRFNWFISYPINNYNVSLNIGDYVHFSDTFYSVAGKLPLDYYVLRPNLEKAQAHFAQVGPMMACYEEYFAPYPFFKDGFALIETPYLGMEHQSGIAYGNGYKTGYAGYDISRIGMTFDYMIIHETGHEWWGNSVTCADMADLWIHEGFCTYSESLYVECMHGYETAQNYVNAKKPGIENKAPMIGAYGVNAEVSGDIYDKGMLMLNTLRHVVQDAQGSDDAWFDLIRAITIDFKHKVISSEELENYMANSLSLDLDAFFDQYLRQASPPVLEFRQVAEDKASFFEYRWNTAVPAFAMPIRMRYGQKDWEPLHPSATWQRLPVNKKAKDAGLVFDQESYYYLLREVN